MRATGLMRSPSLLHQRGGSLQQQLTVPVPPSSSSLLYMYSSDFDDDVTDEARTTPGFQRVASAVALVSGTTVGAGILALASVSQKAGFVPSAVCLVGTWILMASTGLLIAEVTCNIRRRHTEVNEEEAAVTVKSDFGLITITNQLLGNYGSFPAACMYVFIHYSLLIAYIAESGEIIGKATNMGGAWGCVAFTSIMGGCVALAPSKWVELLNNAFFLVVVVSFLSLVAVQAGHMQLGNLGYHNYGAVAPIIPILLVALVYHNVVPTVCMQLDYHRNSIIGSVLLGSFIPLVMFLLWNAVVLGGIPEYQQLAESGAVVDPLQLLRTNAPPAGRQLTEGLISVFSESAIITSFIGFVIGLMEFYSDLFPTRSRSDRGLYALVLVPSAVVAIADPSIFLDALDAAGTYGISLLFGILPALLAIALRRRSAAAAEGYVAGTLEGDCSEASLDADESMASTNDAALHSAEEREEEDGGDAWEEDSSMPLSMNSMVELTAAAAARRGGAYSHVSTEEQQHPADLPATSSGSSSTALQACLRPHQRVSASQHPYTVFLPGGDASLYLIVAVVVGIVVAKITSSTSM